MLQKTNNSRKNLLGFPGGAAVKESKCNAGDLGLILGQEEPLEKEMATHFSILAWEIPLTEEPGGLQLMGLQSQSQLSYGNHIILFIIKCIKK